MAGTNYTDKQHAEHVERWQKTGAFPDNSVFDPAGHAAGGPLFRKLAADESAPEHRQADDESDDAGGGKEA